MNVIDVQWTVQYRIKDPVHFLFKVRDSRQTVRDMAQAPLRRVVDNRPGSDMRTAGRVAQGVTPPDTMTPAFTEANEARQDRARTINPTDCVHA